MYKKPSQEEMNKRRELYAELCERYLMEVWNGEENEISDTLDCYKESVVHYGEGFDTSWLFFMDELKYTYGEYELIKEILKIVNKED